MIVTTNDALTVNGEKYAVKKSGKQFQFCIEDEIISIHSNQDDAYFELYETAFDQFDIEVLERTLKLSRIGKMIAAYWLKQVDLHKAFIANDSLYVIYVEQECLQCVKVSNRELQLITRTFNEDDLYVYNEVFRAICDDTLPF